MKQLLLFTTALIISVHVLAEENKHPAQLLKKDLVGSCVSRGLQRDNNPDAVYMFCSCTWDVLSQNLTVEQYVQLDALSTTNGNITNLSFWSELQPKLQLCKEKEAGATKP